MRLFFQFILAAICLLTFSACQKQEKTAFRLLAPEQTGINFANVIQEHDTVNILDMEFVYNGGGVGVGDLNGDGLEDLFFTGNQVDNRLYLNRGKLKFEDITERAGVQKKNQHTWSQGINILDLNLDGRLDLYVCNSVNPDPENSRNLFFVNQGNDPQGAPQFKELAKEYGLDHPGQTPNGQFFDFDNDGDLDLFLSINFIEQQYPNQFMTRVRDGSAPNRDILLENTWNDSLGHPVFTDISLQAGIIEDGYSHSVLICDVNGDGWMDIYVANDYRSNDILYLNEPGKNGKRFFTNRIADIFRHQSWSSMGSDLADLNADGNPEFFTTEMQPFYNKRKKLFQGGTSYQIELFTDQYKYERQYTRNVLQMHQGLDPVSGLPAFSEVGMFAGVQETDWSWAALFGDYDNDGDPDLYVANGFPRDVTDLDFANFRKSIESTLISRQELYDRIPQVKSSNFMFRNDGNPEEQALQFTDVTESWNLKEPSYSNGAAYADLDNDGDLDLVTNNINDPAFVFENQSNPALRKEADLNYLRVKLAGAAKNPDAFGATVEVFFDGGKRQKSWLLSARGYLSKPENTLHFGLGAVKNVDSLVVVWPSDGTRSVLKNIPANQVLAVNHADNQGLVSKAITPKGFFANATSRFGLHWKDETHDFMDFNFQRTLPHKFSQYGPCIAVGDVNGDALDDFYLGGSGRYESTWFLQKPGGGFSMKKADYKTDSQNKEEESAALLFDADGDGDNDLYLVRGSGQFPAGDSLYQDVLCVNDGKGNFTLSPGSLPEMRANGSCVKAADFDTDGDLDLFVGSRVLPKAYPMPDRSFLLRNDSKTGTPKFTDVTEALCPDLLKPGMVSDALWTDFNNDYRPDLLLACEWSPLKFYQNTGINFTPLPEQNIKACTPPTANCQLPTAHGWWNSLAAADLDNDGDMDYIAGNFGENLNFRCTEKEPLHLYAKDFDANQSVDPFLSCYWKDSLGKKHEYLYHPRDDMMKQWVGIRKKFNTFGAYGEATVQDVFSVKDLEGATVLEANWIKTSVLENLGDGKFRLQALPAAAQFAPVYGILPYDVNADGLLDLCLVGNDYGMELIQGRADAFTGLVLLNRGRWQLEALPMEESRFSVLKDAKGIVSLLSASGEEMIVATQNRDSLRVMTPLRNLPIPPVFLQAKPGEVKAIITFEDGTKRVEEFFYGSTFVSQKARYLAFFGKMKGVEWVDRKGKVVRQQPKIPF